jgi:hypothetical protein
MNVNPASSTALAKCARSDRNPYPGWIAVALALLAASRIEPIDR